MASRSPRINPYNAKGEIKPIAKPWEEILRDPICRKFHPKILVNAWNKKYNDLRLERGRVFISIVRSPESETFNILSSSGFGDQFNPNASAEVCIDLLKRLLKQRL